MKLIYKPYGSDPATNPRGYPSLYPMESRLIGDADQIPSGFTEISQADYSVLVGSFTAEVAAINAQAESAPDEVLLYQFRAAVTLAGLKDAVDSAIAALPEPAKTVANEKWEYGNTVRRNHPMIVSLGAAIGQSPAQIDAIFRSAATIS